MRKLTLLLGCIVLGVLANAQFNDQEVFVKTQQDSLWGTYLYPEIENTEIAALFIAGSGPTDRDGNNNAMKNNSLKYVALELVKYGIPSIRYDKRGVASSASAFIQEKDLTFQNNVDDAQYWLDYLKDKGHKKIVIIGHSEGSLVGALLAKANEETVVGFISMAGAGRKIQDVLKEQYTKTAPVVRDSAYVCLDMLANGQTIDTLSPWLYSIFRPSVQPYIISWMQLNPVEVVSSLQIPILVVQGDKDLQTSLNDAKLLAEANDKTTLYIAEGVNHVLKQVGDSEKLNKSSYNDPKRPVDQDLLFEIIKFLKAL